MVLRRYRPGLFGWGRLSSKWGYDFNGTAIVTEDKVLVVDPVEPTLAELEAIKALGSRFEIILLNADHERYSAELSSALDSPVFVHAADRDGLQNPQALAFDDGHEFAGGWIAIQLHGHKTPGECALYNAESKTLLLGDAVIGDPVSGLRFVPPQKLPDPEQAMASINELLELRFDCLILSDGFVLPHGGHEALSGFASPS
jgi:glyoxylase-like metal-dependent hydrolase (beta-lactamase superfamily II)